MKKTILTALGLIFAISIFGTFTGIFVLAEITLSMMFAILTCISAIVMIAIIYFQEIGIW